MALLKNRYSIGWYGRCTGCVDVELATAPFRYDVHSIFKVDEESGDVLEKWKPNTRRVENDYGGGAKYDEIFNTEFNKLECGFAYMIVNSEEKDLIILNFVEFGGSVTQDCECET